jgi:CDP-diacylglycerol--glycerol-3-phosphate 3-phosphatidyltransferase
MDPLVDKIMMAAGFICLIPAHALPAWAAIVIISREFLITGLRLLAANKGVVLSAERAGKHKTIWQIVTVLFFLALLSLHEMDVAGWIPVSAWWMEVWSAAWLYGGRTLVALTLILTLYSGLSYLWKNRALIAPE